MAEMINDFNSLPWHDSELKEIRIFWSNAGRYDDLVLSVSWITGNLPSFVVFKRIYKIKMDINMGFIGGEVGEPIYTSDYGGEDNPLVQSVHSFFKKVGELSYYRIELTTSGSVIEVVAKSWELSDSLPNRRA